MYLFLVDSAECLNNSISFRFLYGSHFSAPGLVLFFLVCQLKALNLVPVGL